MIALPVDALINVMISRYIEFDKNRPIYLFFSHFPCNERDDLFGKYAGRLVYQEP
jgi:hypothetical protein